MAGGAMCAIRAPAWRSVAMLRSNARATVASMSSRNQVDTSASRYSDSGAWLRATWRAASTSCATMASRTLRGSAQGVSRLVDRGMAAGGQPRVGNDGVARAAGEGAGRVQAVGQRKGAGGGPQPGRVLEAHDAVERGRNPYRSAGVRAQPDERGP